ncbi:MAG: bifunctional folylpolyglutamate synthase/dihydrofolate synthase [Prevotella sp.]|nr:bifunctional folylpolyglutamate synthase/dihydrofolate synthase [Prevotella sp.]
MTYQETVEYLFNSTPVFEHVGASAYKEGLETTKALDEHFGHPHTHFLSIHVAGTNGKGSCSHTLAAILHAEGYKVGLYTSPHLVDFRFAEQKVDIAIIEVGLGGRLDCTNIITPILSIITNISLDHTQFLGNTLGEIAAEKAGIIKQGVPVIIGEAVPETQKVFLAKAQTMDSLIVFAEDIPAVLSSQALPGGGRAYETRFFGHIKGELGGNYQEKNANTVLTAAMHLYNKGVIKNTESIEKGFANVCEKTGLMGRWQTIQKQPLVICDTGHNAGGWKYLSQQIKHTPCKQRRIVFGMVDDKDLHSVMGMLPVDAVYYWTQPSTHRAFPVHKVSETADAYDLRGKQYPTVMEAYRAAIADADKDDFIFVGGSSYVVADLLTGLQ